MFILTRNVLKNLKKKIYLKISDFKELKKQGKFKKFIKLPRKLFINKILFSSKKNLNLIPFKNLKKTSIFLKFLKKEKNKKNNFFFQQFFNVKKDSLFFYFKKTFILYLINLLKKKYISLYILNLYWKILYIFNRKNIQILRINLILFKKLISVFFKKANLVFLKNKNLDINNLNLVVSLEQEYCDYQEFEGLNVLKNLKVKEFKFLKKKKRFFANTVTGLYKIVRYNPFVLSKHYILNDFIKKITVFFILSPRRNNTFCTIRDYLNKSIYKVWMGILGLNINKKHSSVVKKIKNSGYLKRVSYNRIALYEESILFFKRWNKQLNRYRLASFSLMQTREKRKVGKFAKRVIPRTKFFSKIYVFNKRIRRSIKPIQISVKTDLRYGGSKLQKKRVRRKRLRTRRLRGRKIGLW